jgi:hypothetical protein
MRRAALILTVTEAAMLWLAPPWSRRLQRYELRGEQQAALWVLSAHERLSPDDLASHQRSLGLVVDFDLILL